MKRDDDSASSSSVPKTKKPSVTVFYTLADTTWRVAIPTVLFAGLGMFADKTFKTLPWLTLLGLVVGLVSAGWLVWSQLQKVNKAEDIR